MIDEEKWNTFSFDEKVQIYFNAQEIRDMKLNPKQYGYKGGE